jgi:lipoyl(octanoyl) transferase
LGEVSYADGLALQDLLVKLRRAGAVPDTLLLLAHPHVITRGTGSDDAHILADARERARLGIELHDAGRGGDVTYHGPGQLVGYPIVDLKPDRKDLHRWLRDLEGALVGALGAFGIDAGRSPGQTGVWTASGKVAAIGVRVSSGWITSHGFALNVDPRMEYFRTIVPCGIADRPVTSMARELETTPPWSRVCDVVEASVAEALGARLEAGTPEEVHLDTLDALWSRQQ